MDSGEMEVRGKVDGLQSWSGCSLEENMLDDTDPELVNISFSGSYSSQKSSVISVPHSTPVISASPRHVSDSGSSITTCVSPQLQECESTRFHSRKKLSISLHDMLEFPEHAIASSKFQSQSMTTLPSLRQSRDSGLPQSVSSQSLISRARSYEHIQSKVKEYIRNIKTETARNRKLKSSHDNLDPPEITEVDELKQKLSDSELYISVLHNNYQELLLKHAAAQRKIDELKIKTLHHSYNKTSSSSLIGKAMKPVSRHCAVQTGDVSSKVSELDLMHIVPLIPISPVTKTYMTSLKLAISPTAQSREVRGSEETFSRKQLASDNCSSSPQEDVVSKVKRWQDSLSPADQSPSHRPPEAKPVDSGYAGSVPNIVEVPPLNLGSLLDSGSDICSTLTCSTGVLQGYDSSTDLDVEHCMTGTPVAVMRSLIDNTDSTSTSYRSIRIPLEGNDKTIATDRVSEIKMRDSMCKEHLRLLPKDKEMLMKCLEDLNMFAQHLKSRSEAVRHILMQHLHSTQ